MKHDRIRYLAALSFLAATGCSSSQIQVGGDHQADFSKYKTYAWAAAERPTATWALEGAIKAAAAKELALKGLRETRDSHADLVISYYAVLQDGVTYGATPGPWHWGPIDEVVAVKEGSLTLELVDPKSNQEIWQGTATNILSDANSGQDRIRHAVQDLIRKYPLA